MRAVIMTTLLVGAALLSLSGATGALDETTLQPASTVSVDLLVHTDFAAIAGFAPGSPDTLVGTASCSVEVPAGSNAGDVLDQAVLTGCILEWDYDEFDGFGRYATSIDGLRSVGLTCAAGVVCDWWEFRVNSKMVLYGIDDYIADSGDLVEFFFHTA